MMCIYYKTPQQEPSQKAGRLRSCMFESFGTHIIKTDCVI